MRQIDISRQADKFLKTLLPKHGRQIALKLLQLQMDPCPVDMKHLKNKQNIPYRRVDSGEYRIIYYVDESDTLRIALIGKRNDDEVYQLFKRL